jgi:hypothetical protein
VLLRTAGTLLSAAGALLRTRHPVPRTTSIPTETAMMLDESPEDARQATWNRPANAV